MGRIIRSNAQYEHPRWPKRDDAALSPTEDLDREPDGIPHAVIGLVFLGTLIVAALVLVLLAGHVPSNRGAKLLVVFAIPAIVTLVVMLVRRWRTPGAHPSR